MERTTCCVVGGGPAGMMLGLLLARAGVAVTVLEKHGDFLRDFRGDTVHPSTLTLLDELGLGAEFVKIPHRLVEQLQTQVGDDLVQVFDFRRIPGPHKHLASSRSGISSTCSPTPVVPSRPSPSGCTPSRPG